MKTSKNPLHELRQQGLEADLFKSRLRIYPRSRMNRAVCQFVTENLAEIVDLVVNEQSAKAGEDAFLWNLPPKIGVELFGFEVDMVEKIPIYLNGEFFY